MILHFLLSMVHCSSVAQVLVSPDLLYPEILNFDFSFNFFFLLPSLSTPAIASSFVCYPAPLPFLDSSLI